MRMRVTSAHASSTPAATTSDEEMGGGPLRRLLFLQLLLNVGWQKQVRGCHSQYGSSFTRGGAVRLRQFVLLLQLLLQLRLLLWLKGDGRKCRQFLQLLRNHLLLLILLLLLMLERMKDRRCRRRCRRRRSGYRDDLLPRVRWRKLLLLQLQLLLLLRAVGSVENDGRR